LNLLYDRLLVLKQLLHYRFTIASRDRICRSFTSESPSRKSFADGTEKLLLSCRESTGAKLRQEHVAGSGGEAIVGAVKRSSNVVKS